MNVPAEKRSDAPAGFITAWRARWPEWDLARIFIPTAQRDIVDAWFALLQTLTDAAWSGSDPTPGLAKLAWWQEELQGWSKGARRHPLGEVLQRLSAPWLVLSAALLSLQKSRESTNDVDEARALHPFASAVAACESALFGSAADAAALIVRTLSDERRLLDLQVADAQNAMGRRISDDAPAISGGTTPRRVHAALVRARLVRTLKTGRRMPLPPWRTVFTAWRAARGLRSAT